MKEEMKRQKCTSTRTGRASEDKINKLRREKRYEDLKAKE
jgi:hypothetical protein